MTTLGEDLIAAASEALRHARGEPTEAVEHIIPDPKTVREKVKLTQEQMAPLLGLSLSGYRKIEQGRRAVSGPAGIVLRILDREPEAVMRALAQ